MTLPSSDPQGRVGLRRMAESMLPTEYGDFQIIVYEFDDPKAHASLSNEHVALVKGDVAGAHDLPVRIHSECITGETFGSMKCDCREQLVTAQRMVQAAPAGCVLYLRQEGRGIGLGNKIRAYALQDQGADTIEANERLSLPVDARCYAVAAQTLRDLGVKSIRLITNNPAKLQAMEEHGVRVTGRIPIVVGPNQHSESYLRVKRERMSHMLPDAASVDKT